MIVCIYTAVHSQNCYSSTLLVSYIHVPVQACLPSILCYLDKLTVLTLCLFSIKGSSSQDHKRSAYIGGDPHFSIVLPDNNNIDLCCGRRAWIGLQSYQQFKILQS